MKTQLMRSTTNKQIAGVAGGLAEAFGWDVTLVRLGFVGLALLNGGGLLLYVILWLAMPRAGERSVLQQTVAGAHSATALLTSDRNRTLGLALLGAGGLLLAGALDLSGPVIALAFLGLGWYLIRQR
ncbi:MAG TPA: PspC domain-containing protein [Herpetosiphonaceae bacterium]